MPSCPLKTEHALLTNAAIFKHMLIFGLYFRNAKERRKSQCEPMNIFIEFQTVLGFDLIVYILQFMSEFFKPLFIQGRFAEGLLLLSNPPASHSCSYTFTLEMQLQYSSGNNRAVLLELLVFSCLAQLMIVAEGQESICHLWHLLKIFLAGSKIWTGKILVTSAFLRPSREGRVLHVHLTCHEFRVKIMSSGRNGCCALEARCLCLVCREGGCASIWGKRLFILVTERNIWRGLRWALGSWQWHHFVLSDIISKSNGKWMCSQWHVCAHIKTQIHTG